jgi:hypothetical protein
MAFKLLPSFSYSSGVPEAMQQEELNSACKQNRAGLMALPHFTVDSGAFTGFTLAVRSINHVKG